MLLIRRHHQADTDAEADDAPSVVGPDLAQNDPPMVQETPTLEQSVRTLHTAGHSQRSIARDLNVDRRNLTSTVAR
jgi:hypothetical protein